MRKKIFLIIIMVLLCAGCKARYNIKINKDGSVEETLVADETPEFYEQYTHMSVGKVISNILSVYLNDLNSKKYLVESHVYVNMDSGSTIKKKYDNFKEYVGNSIIYSQFTDKIEYIEEKDKVTIKAKGKFSHSEQNQDLIPVDDGSIRIVVPYKVLENNADVVNGDTYIWNFDEKDEEKREIKLVYTKSKIQNLDFDYNAVIIVVILVVLSIVSVIICKRFRTSRKEANKI